MTVMQQLHNDMSTMMNLMTIADNITSVMARNHGGLAMTV